MNSAVSNPAAAGTADATGRPSFGAYVVGLLATLVLRLWHISWRKEIAEASRLDDVVGRGEKYVAVFWHGKFIPLFPLLAGRQACIFASQSFRGQVIAEICRRFGYDCVLLPTSEGRLSRALIRDALRSHNAAGMAVDGPLGPYHKVKRGALDVGASLGFTLIPVSASARRRRILEERWDQREIPRLFTRIVLTVGEPLKVPSPLGAREAVVLRQRLHDELEALGRRADAASGFVPPSPEGKDPASALLSEDGRRRS